MYDLDKTQQWLDRTLQLSKAPPLRGGLVPDRTARRDVTISVGVTLLLLAFFLRLGSGVRPAPAVVATAGYAQFTASQRVTDAAVAEQPHRHSVPNRERRLSFDPDMAVIQMDGAVRPLPGHVAPPAPTWLDGSVAAMPRR